MNDLRLALLGSDDLPREPAKDIPQAWTDAANGAEFYVQAVPLEAWEPYLNEQGEFAVTTKAVGDIVAQGLVTEDGTPIFKRTDAKAIAKKNGRALMSLCTQIMRLSDLGEEQQEDIRESFGGAQPGTTSDD